MPPGGALGPALREAFLGAREQRGAWLGALAGAAPLLGALGSLAEQARALQAAEEAEAGLALSRGPLRPFPALRGRLRAKHRAAAEALLAQLQQQILPQLQGARDALGARVAGVLLLCEGGPRAELGLESFLQRRPLCPSPADMLEWLLDIERLYHQTYLEAKLLLLQVRYENLAEMQALPKAWEQLVQRSRQQQGTVVEDALLKVSFFLEDVA